MLRAKRKAESPFDATLTGDSAGSPKRLKADPQGFAEAGLQQQGYGIQAQASPSPQPLAGLPSPHLAGALQAPGVGSSPLHHPASSLATYGSGALSGTEHNTPSSASGQGWQSWPQPGQPGQPGQPSSPFASPQLSGAWPQQQQLSGQSAGSGFAPAGGPQGQQPRPPDWDWGQQPSQSVSSTGQAPGQLLALQPLQRSNSAPDLRIVLPSPLSSFLSSPEGLPSYAASTAAASGALTPYKGPQAMIAEALRGQLARALEELRSGRVVLSRSPSGRQAVVLGAGPTPPGAAGEGHITLSAEGLAQLARAGMVPGRLASEMLIRAKRAAQEAERRAPPFVHSPPYDRDPGPGVVIEEVEEPGGPAAAGVGMPGSGAPLGALGPQPQVAAPALDNVGSGLTAMEED